ncbi:MAG: histidinol dehydrogenase [Proteobacteria bacterium]|nr:MAG: histidinol dehydrogenase [Pseudomonadota bacterium]
MNADIRLIQDYQRPAMCQQTAIVNTVQDIMQQVVSRGDAAIEQFSRDIDGFSPKLIELKEFADYDLSFELKTAIKSSHQRIKKFCSFQADGLKTSSFQDDCGEYTSLYQPIERIGAYIPGGRFPLISTALMTLTPAQVVGCPVRIACSPSNHPAILAAASLAGATTFLQLGGAQAIAALSYGWQDISPVDMVVGPGNAYVNQAKAQIQHRTKIDTLAGPSELLIYANEVQHIDWLVADALAQAEHDPAAVSVVVSESLSLLNQIKALLMAHNKSKSLFQQDNIVLLHSNHRSHSIQFINEFAPEHLQICAPGVNPGLFKNYGALFLGENSAVAFGDYCSGPNHTLPTAGAAKYSGGLSVHQFLKVLTRQKISNRGRSALAKIATEMARAEGLIEHQNSAELRQSK